MNRHSAKIALLACFVLPLAACGQQGAGGGAAGAAADDSPEYQAYQFRDGMMHALAWKVGKLRAMAQAGRSLGLLHRAGMVHGRPAVRDICWDGSEARFIDLERFSTHRHSAFWQAADLVMLAQTANTRWPQDARWLEAALAGYAGTAPAGAMDRAARLARRLAPLGWLAAVLCRLKPKSRELRAVGLTLARLRQG